MIASSLIIETWSDRLRRHVALRGSSGPCLGCYTNLVGHVGIDSFLSQFVYPLREIFRDAFVTSQRPMQVMTLTICQHLRSHPLDYCCSAFGLPCPFKFSWYVRRRVPLVYETSPEQAELALGGDRMVALRTKRSVLVPCLISDPALY
jgi:hypothetical protein